MQRKAYVPGAVVLLAALLAACTGSSGNGDAAEDSKAGGVTASATAAQPGKYRTLSDACGTVNHDILDSLLPGIKQTADQEQRDKSYQGESVPTYNNDRRSGCRWKAESTGATDRLYVDFERVVSYDNAVSDDNRAHDVYFTKEEAANLPEPVSGAAGGSANDGDSPTTSAPPSAGVTPSGTATASPPASASAPPPGARRPPRPRPTSSPAHWTTSGRGVPRRPAEHRRAAHRDCGVPHVQRDRDHRVRRAADRHRSGA
ncbi:hypothetical protein MBT84_18935 [Streptomyces sp. MBT84]|nr:hypothetical protein [Streptomyces sp. MBT84]